MVPQTFILTAKIEIPTGTQTNVANTEIETQPGTV